MKKSYKTPATERFYKSERGRLLAIGYKLQKKGDGFAILAYNADHDMWMEAAGLTPYPYCLSLVDVINFRHEAQAEAEIEELIASEKAEASAADRRADAQPSLAAV